MTEDPRYGGPWYRHPWPWFIVGMLGSTVVAGIATVVIAVRGADSLVVDDYYREGKAINRRIEADREAASRQAKALLRVQDGVVVRLDIQGEAPDALVLELSHVTRAELDRRLRLVRTDPGLYSTDGPLPAGRYHATLRAAGDEQGWRLRRRIELPRDAEIPMEPTG